VCGTPRCVRTPALRRLPTLSALSRTLGIAEPPSLGLAALAVWQATEHRHGATPCLSHRMSSRVKCSSCRLKSGRTDSSQQASSKPGAVQILLRPLGDLVVQRAIGGFGRPATAPASGRQGADTELGRIHRVACTATDEADAGQGRAAQGPAKESLIYPGSPRWQ
jgi:hypothetical protein